MWNWIHRSGNRRALQKWRSSAVALRHNEDDILSAKQRTELDALLAESGALSAAGAVPDGVREQFESRLERIVPPKRFARLRDWLDVLAVALAVAFGIRALFFQPFKIPTSSMQPTLYGIHYVEDGGASAWQKFCNRFNALFLSADRARLIVPEAGFPEYLAPRGNSAEIGFASRGYRLPGEPSKVAEYTRIENRQYAKGEVVCDGYVVTGDHLFVERFSPYLFGPKRGDITVFTTEGIRNYDGQPLTKSGFYYIKRLVGLPGDTLRIVDDQLFIRPKGETEFRHIRTFGKAFEKLYSGKGGYQGHSNSLGGGAFSNHLSSGDVLFTVPDDSYFLMGDNTRFSSDSRVWGTVPRRNIVGTAFWVFWPLSRRWGIADGRGPVDVPTGESYGNTFPSMYQQ